MIHVVVGIVINPQGKILISERPAHQYCGGLWEFPGGKVEGSESRFDALYREFREELGIQIISADAWFECQHEYEDRTVLLDVWRVSQFTGEPRGVEGQTISWVLPEELYLFKFPAGNGEILKRLSIL